MHPVNILGAAFISMSLGPFRSILFAVSLVCSFLCVRPAKAAEVWTQVETKNFVLAGNASETQIRFVALRLERFRSALRKIFPGIRDGDPVRTHVVVFKDVASFRQFKPKRADGTTDEQVAGLFQPGEDINYIAISADIETDSSYGTIFHEYVHYALNQSLVRSEAAPWLNEGLAEYFQTFQIIDDRTALIGSLQTAHLNLLRQKPLMPWDEFFKLDNFTLQQSGDHSRSVFYAQAWAFMHLLLKRIASRDAISPRELMRVASELNIEDIDAGVKSFIAHRSNSNSTITVTGEPAMISMRTSLLPEAEANALLGSLLYHLRQDISAENYLRKSLVLDPNLSAANATLGLVRLRQKKFDDAKRLIERAVAADAKNHLVHFYYAYLLCREQTDEFGSVVRFSADTAAKIRESLDRAIKLNAEFAESYKLLAFVSTVTGEDLNEALSALKKAAALQPGNQEYALLTAQIYLRQERIDEALTIAEGLYRAAENEALLRSEAQAVIKSANEYRRTKLAGDKVSIELESDNPRKPIIVKWSSLTKEEIADIVQDREIFNLNIMIGRPGPDELQAVGFIEKIACSSERIFYSVKTSNGVLRLTSYSFDELRLKVLLNGTRSFAFACDSRLADEMVVVVYKPRKSLPGSDGELISVEFVPKFFKLKTREDIVNYRTIIIEGGPKDDISANALNAKAEREEMDRTMRETQFADLEERLRKPNPDERQITGTPEKMECINGKVFYQIRSNDKLFTFESLIKEPIEIRSFTPETGIVEIGCRSQLPSLPAVFTYRPAPSGEASGVLLSIEFVPKIYLLRNQNL
jgi:tetratricopeptide (TPR) repeat protein